MSAGFAAPHTQPELAEPSVLPTQGSAQPERDIDSDMSNQSHMSELRTFPFSHYISYLEFPRENQKCQLNYYMLSKVLLPGCPSTTSLFDSTLNVIDAISGLQGLQPEIHSSREARTLTGSYS